MQEDTIQNTEDDAKGGFLLQSLSRTNADIRKDRGDAIFEDLEIAFKRDVEDAHRKIKQIERQRKDMYDFSPNSTTSLVLAKNVQADEILQKDKVFTLEMRDAKIDFDLAQERYTFLFGKPVIIS